jgi:hypothetical protein
MNTASRGTCFGGNLTPAQPPGLSHDLVGGVVGPEWRKPGPLNVADPQLDLAGENGPHRRGSPPVKCWWSL